MDQKINVLETDERQMIQQGANAAAAAEKKQVAGKLMRLRRELRRQRGQAQLFTQQIDIIGTHIHHLTLAEQGKRLTLPSAEDLTREAAQAEQVMTEVAVNADLAASIEVTGETPMMAEEEQAAIFEEFNQVAASQIGVKPTEKAASEAPAAASEPELVQSTRRRAPAAD